MVGRDSKAGGTRSEPALGEMVEGFLVAAEVEGELAQVKLGSFGRVSREGSQLFERRDGPLRLLGLAETQAQVFLDQGVLGKAGLEALVLEDRLGELALAVEKLRGQEARLLILRVMPQKPAVVVQSVGIEPHLLVHEAEVVENLGVERPQLPRLLQFVDVLQGRDVLGIGLEALLGPGDGRLKPRRRQGLEPPERRAPARRKIGPRQGQSREQHGRGRLRGERHRGPRPVGRGPGEGKEILHRHGHVRTAQRCVSGESSWPRVRGAGGFRYSAIFLRSRISSNLLIETVTSNVAGLTPSTMAEMESPGL